MSSFDVFRMSIAVERLAEELRCSAFDDTDAAECLALRDVAALLEYASGRLDKLLDAEVHPDVAALAAMCVCGHDRGEHLVDAPHTCEGVAFIEGPRAAIASVLGGFPSCCCPGFEAEPELAPAADTEPALERVPSEPPPATGEAS
jgi:hypothetical protein